MFLASFPPISGHSCELPYKKFVWFDRSCNWSCNPHVSVRGLLAWLRACHALARELDRVGPEGIFRTGTAQPRTATHIIPLGIIQHAWVKFYNFAATSSSERVKITKHRHLYRLLSYSLHFFHPISHHFTSCVIKLKLKFIMIFWPDTGVGYFQMLAINRYN